MPQPSHNRDPAEGKSFDPKDGRQEAEKPEPPEEGLMGPEGDPAEGRPDVVPPP